MTREERLFRIAWRERACMYFVLRILGYGSGPADFDDLVQRVMLDAWRLIVAGRLVIDPGRDERHAIRAWLPSVARISALHYRRDRCEGKPIGVPLDFDVAGVDPVPRLEARDAVRVALYRVNKREREVLSRVANGEQLNEIGVALSIPMGTAANTLRNVRIALKKRRRRER